METFLHSHPIFSVLPNSTFLTSETHKFKFEKFLPHALSPTQNEPKQPKRSQINPHLDHETAVDVLLEEAAYRCFDLAHTDLAHLSPNRATHLKSPKNKHGMWIVSQQMSLLLYPHVADQIFFCTAEKALLCRERGSAQAFEQSGTWRRHTADLAVDGNSTDPGYFGPSCAVPCENATIQSKLVKSCNHLRCNRQRARPVILPDVTQSPCGPT